MEIKHIEESIDGYGKKKLLKVTKSIFVNLVNLLCCIGFTCLCLICVFVILKSMHILTVPHIESTCNILTIFVTFLSENRMFSKFLKIHLVTHPISPTITGINSDVWFSCLVGP